jgi:acetylornithine deacetylase
LIKGGTIINRVPDYAAMSFDIRTINFENYKKAIECIKIKINELEKSYGCTIKIENKLRIPPLSNNNDSIIQNISKCLKAKVSTFLGGCEAGYYKEYSGDAILFGVGDLELAHKPNEYMVIDDFIIYKEKILILLNKLKEIYF